MIRKISIGSDYKNAMHYSIGQSFFLKGIGDVEIHSVDYTPSQGYKILISHNGEIMIWKHLNNAMPVVVEYDLSAM